MFFLDLAGRDLAQENDSSNVFCVTVQKQEICAMDAKTSELNGRPEVSVRSEEERRAAWEKLENLRKRIGARAKALGVTEEDLAAIRNG